MESPVGTPSQPMILVFGDSSLLDVKPSNSKQGTDTVGTVKASPPVMSVAPMKRHRPLSTARQALLLPKNEDHSSDEEDEDDRPKKRRRENLDHLTPAEKLARRKMKNRVAAQCARDRKKTRIEHIEQTLDDLETKVTQLEAENSRLKTENETLKEILLKTVPGNKTSTNSAPTIKPLPTKRKRNNEASAASFRTSSRRNPPLALESAARTGKRGSSIVEPGPCSDESGFDARTVDEVFGGILQTLCADRTGFVEEKETGTSSSSGYSSPPPPAFGAPLVGTSQLLLEPTGHTFDFLDEKIPTLSLPTTVEVGSNGIPVLHSLSSDHLYSSMPPPDVSVDEEYNKLSLPLLSGDEFFSDDPTSSSSLLSQDFLISPVVAPTSSSSSSSLQATEEDYHLNPDQCLKEFEEMFPTLFQEN